MATLYHRFYYITLTLMLTCNIKVNAYSAGDASGGSGHSNLGITNGDTKWDNAHYGIRVSIVDQNGNLVDGTKSHDYFSVGVNWWRTCYGNTPTRRKDKLAYASGTTCEKDKNYSYLWPQNWSKDWLTYSTEFGSFRDVNFATNLKDKILNAETSVPNSSAIATETAAIIS